MSDYIKREEAINAACVACRENNVCYRKQETCPDIQPFKRIPAADVVEVVRCKDCIFGHCFYEIINGVSDSWVECQNPEGLNRDVSPDGYCSASIKRVSEDESD